MFSFELLLKLCLKLCSAATEEEMLEYVKKNLVNKGILSAKIQTAKSEEKLAPIPIDLANLKSSQVPVQTKLCQDCLAMAKIIKGEIEKDPVGQFEKWAQLAGAFCLNLPGKTKTLCQNVVTTQVLPTKISLNFAPILKIFWHHRIFSPVHQIRCLSSVVESV